MHSLQVELRALVGAEQQLEHRLGQAALRQVVRGRDAGGVAGEELRQARLVGQVHLRRQAGQARAGDVLPHGAAELVLGLAQQDQGVLLVRGRQRVRDGLLHVLHHAQHADHGGGQDRRLAGLVVEGHIAAGDWDGQLSGAVGKPVHCLAELPHHIRVLRGAEVEAVGHRNRGGAGDGDVAVRLRERQARAHVRVEVGVAARRVSGNGHAAVGFLVDAQHAGVGVLGLHGVAAHVAVVLLGDEVAGAQRGRCDHLQPCVLDVALLLDVTSGLHTILPIRARVGTLVDRALVDSRRRGVHHELAVVEHLQAVLVRGDLADDGREHVPLGADLHELIDVLRRHNRTHALLRLGGENLRGGHVLRAQRDIVQVDSHAAVARRREFGGGAGQAAAAQVLDALDHAGGVELEAALDEDLLRERVAHLDGRQLALLALLEGGGAQHGHAADAVEAGAGAEQDDLVAGAGGERQVEVFHLQRAHAQRVDQRVAGVRRVEDGLAADVGQAQAVAVAADAVDDAR